MSRFYISKTCNPFSSRPFVFFKFYFFHLSFSQCSCDFMPSYIETLGQPVTSLISQIQVFLCTTPCLFYQSTINVNPLVYYLTQRPKSLSSTAHTVLFLYPRDKNPNFNNMLNFYVPSTKIYINKYMKFHLIYSLKKFIYLHFIFLRITNDPSLINLNIIRCYYYTLCLQ